jgi:hypothetical protein
VERWLQKMPRHFEISPGNCERFENGMTTSDALQGALSMSKERIDHYASTRMGNVLRDCGLVARRKSGGNRKRRYYKPDIEPFDEPEEPPSPVQEQLFP